MIDFEKQKIFYNDILDRLLYRASLKPVDQREQYIAVMTNFFKRRIRELKRTYDKKVGG
jgi:hypothetical protein